MQTVALRGWEIIPGPSPIAELRAAQGGRPTEYLSVFRGRPTPAGDADRRLGRREGIVSQPLSVGPSAQRPGRGRRAASLALLAIACARVPAPELHRDDL